MEAAENIGRSKTLTAGSATLIFLAFFIASILTVALIDTIDTLAGTSLAWLGVILYPIIACVALVLAAVRLIPADIKKVGPTGAAWVLGRWENLLKGLAIGCIIGGVSHMWEALNQSHFQHNAQFHNSHFAEPISRAIVTPGAQQILAIAALALLAPVVEEMMFRGVLYGGFRKSFGPLSAAFVTTVLFVAMHFGYYIYAPYMIVFYIVSALTLLWCRLHWNAIGPAITAHSGVNIAAVVIPSLFLTWQHAFHKSGVADYKASNFNQAIANLTRAIQLGDDSSSVYTYRGNAKFMKGDLAGAISDYSMAIVLNPKDSTSFFDRGFVKHRNSDFEGAIADYDDAIALNPKDSRAYDDRGLAKVGEEKLDEAIADFSSAIELNPTNSSYYNERAWAEFKKGDFGYAIADATRSIHLDPDFGDAYGTRGWARYRTGNVSGAVEDCKRSTHLHKPGSAAFFYDQGLLDFISKDYTQAVADWQNAVKQQPYYKKELQPWIEKAQGLEQDGTRTQTNSSVGSPSPQR
jgi:tetratricopeptide (TPR) repeat protein/membrane protease YdiL (CAAX protease family)